MKKKIADALLFSLLCGGAALAVRLLFRLLYHRFGLVPDTLYYLLLSFIIAFWLFGLTYGKLWTLRKTDSPRKKTGLLLAALAVAAAAFFVLPVHSPIRPFYNVVTSDHVRGWRGRAHRADDTLGFRSIPGATVYETFTAGPDVPVVFDDGGYRVPVGGDTLCTTTSLQLLFLGCSFTYGTGIPAGETFPWRVAHEKGMSYLNAGMGSYGLSQMVLLARRLIPRYKPRYVILQYSPWLAQRSAQLYAPSRVGKLPAPYFSRAGDSLGIAPPVFRPALYDLDKQALRSRYKGRYWSFYFQVGLPFFLHERWQYLKTGFRVLTGMTPAPVTDLGRIERQGYGEIYRLARANGCRVILLKLGFLAFRHVAPASGGLPADAVADADSAIAVYLHRPGAGQFGREYYIWHTDSGKPVMVDKHPNSHIHRVIAGCISRIIR